MFRCPAEHTPGGGDRDVYSVTEAISSTGTAVSAANRPYSSSLVDVYHCPANSTATSGPCVGIVHETWFVHADAASAGYSSQTGLPLTQVGGLQNTQTINPVNAGQFSVPFSYIISTMQ